jgi:peptidyl-prolyl cis-trans isomerase SurA
MKQLVTSNFKISVPGSRRERKLGIALFAVVATTVALLTWQQASAQDSQRIVAIVNDEIISGFDLSSRIDLIILSSQLPKTAEVRKRIQAQVLRGLIDDKLRLQEARRLKLNVNEQEFLRAVQRIEKNNRMKPGGMTDLLKQNNIDRVTFNTQIEARLLWQKIVRRQVRGSVNISAGAIDKAIARMSANKGKPEFLVSEIYIPFEPGKPLDQTRQLGERLYKQIGQGANFEALARAFSQSATAAGGGSLGWIREDQMDKELSEVLVKMSRGTVSKPIKGLDGFYILVVRDRRVSAGLPQADVSVDLQQVFLDLPKGARKETETAQLALAKTVAGSAESCGKLEKLGKELGSSRSGKLNNIKLSNLPANIRGAVEKLKPGQASQPIKAGGGIVVLMMCARRGDLGDEQVRKNVEFLLLQERASLVARRMLRDLRRAAFVDIRQ